MIDRFFASENIEPTIVMDTENVEIIKAMVKTGMGIGIVPYQAVAREVRAGQLFCTRIEGHELVRETGWVYGRANRVPRMIQELLLAFETSAAACGSRRRRPENAATLRRPDVTEPSFHQQIRWIAFDHCISTYRCGACTLCRGGNDEQRREDRDRVISIYVVGKRVAGVRRAAAAAGHLAARADSRRGAILSREDAKISRLTERRSPVISKTVCPGGCVPRPSRHAARRSP